MNKSKRASGELRKSQLLRTYGPGSMVDLPHRSVLIMGLDSWSEAGRQPIDEPRLASHAARLLNISDRNLELFEPPVDEGYEGRASTWVSARIFPLWFLGPMLKERYSHKGGSYRVRPLLHWRSLNKGSYRSERGKNEPVVPFRFVCACARGHLSDIDWFDFVQQEFGTSIRGELFLDEGGAGNELSDTFIRCGQTGKRRSLANASIPGVLGRCSGHRPWLGDRDPEPCKGELKLLVRSASNAYFAQTLSVITIPDTDQRIRDAVQEVWHAHLAYRKDRAGFDEELQRANVASALEGLNPDKVWKEVQRRHQNQQLDNKTLKQVEIETLLSQEREVGEDVPEAQFYARARNLDNLPPRFKPLIERIVLVHRLREVTTLLGFTRFEPVITDIDGELDIQVSPAPLAQEISWLPAVENKGEGVFIAFRQQAIQSWLERPATIARLDQLERGFQHWLERKELSAVPFPGGPYYLLHSLAHLLITAVSLECGYPTSAIRERIYASPSGYGILLYTGGSGSEGTLGGLVEVGRRIEYHLEAALRMGHLCSNDPICSQHKPEDGHEERFLHGSACHGCLLISETCCERRNELLDRALVSPTMSDPDAAFFPAEPLP